MRGGRSLILRSFSYYFMKQFHNCKNQWRCWKKNLKGLGDKVRISSERTTSIRIPSCEAHKQWGLRLRRTDWKSSLRYQYRAFSHDVTAAILVFQNNESAVMLVYQTNPVGVELFSYVNTSFCFSKFAWVLATWVKTLYTSTWPFLFKKGGFFFSNRSYYDFF